MSKKVAVYSIIVAAIVLLLDTRSAYAVTASVAEMFFDQFLRAFENDARDIWIPNAVIFVRRVFVVVTTIAFVLALKDLSLQGNLAMESIIGVMVRFILLIGLVAWLLGTDDGAQFPRVTYPAAFILSFGEAVSGVNPLTSLATLVGLQEAIIGHMAHLTTAAGAGVSGGGSFISFITGSASATVLAAFILFTGTIVSSVMTILFYLIAAMVMMIILEIIFIKIMGLFTLALISISYFRDMFLGYCKALAVAALKLSIVSILIGATDNVLSQMSLKASDLVAGGSFQYGFGLMINLLGATFILFSLVKNCPQFASAIMSGSVMSGVGLGTAAGAMHAGATGFAKAAGLQSGDGKRGLFQGTEQQKGAGALGRMGHIGAALGAVGNMFSTTSGNNGAPAPKAGSVSLMGNTMSSGPSGASGGGSNQSAPAALAAKSVPAPQQASITNGGKIGGAASSQSTAEMQGTGGSLGSQVSAPITDNTSQHANPLLQAQMSTSNAANSSSDSQSAGGMKGEMASLQARMDAMRARATQSTSITPQGLPRDNTVNTPERLSASRARAEDAE